MDLGGYCAQPSRPDDRSVHSVLARSGVQVRQRSVPRRDESATPRRRVRVPRDRRRARVALVDAVAARAPIAVHLEGARQAAGGLSSAVTPTPTPASFRYRSIVAAILDLRLRGVAVTRPHAEFLDISLKDSQLTLTGAGRVAVIAPDGRRFDVDLGPGHDAEQYSARASHRGRRRPVRIRHEDRRRHAGWGHSRFGSGRRHPPGDRRRVTAPVAAVLLAAALALRSRVRTRISRT